MLGLLDHIAISLHKKNIKYSGDLVRHYISQPGSMTWICFLPWRTKLDVAQKYEMLPKHGNLIVYEVPVSLLGETPHLTKESIHAIHKDFIQVHEEYNLYDKEISFVGISAGTIPAFYLANRYACSRLIVVCPTTRLGEGIFSAKAARNIKRGAISHGFTAESYDEEIKEINIENNIENIPDDVMIHLSRFDQFVPFSGGHELVSKIKKHKKNVSVNMFHAFGHILTLCNFGKETDWGES